MIQWHNILREALSRTPRETRNATTRATFGHTLTFDLLNNGFPCVTTKRLAWRLAFVELCWMMKGYIDVEWLKNRGCHFWDDFELQNDPQPDGLVMDLDIASKPSHEWNGTIGPSYGFQWRAGCCGDQLGQVVKALRENPHDRRMIVDTWDTSFLDQMALPPCHPYLQFFARGDSLLDLLVVCRSNDLFLGFPMDVVVYAGLVEAIARLTMRTAGELVYVIGDAHIYHDHQDQIGTVINRVCRTLPELKIEGDPSRIEDFEPEMFVLQAYDPHPTVKAPLIP